MTLRVELEGFGGARGLAAGRARVLYPTRFEVDLEPLGPDEVEGEVARFMRALEAARTELAVLRKRLRGALTREIGDFIEAHSLILDDPEFIDGVTTRIRGRLQRASAALDAQREALSAAFDAIDDPYLRSRREDIEQVIARVFAAFRRGGARRRDPRRTPPAPCWCARRCRRPTSTGGTNTAWSRSWPARAASTRTRRSSRAACASRW